MTVFAMSPLRQVPPARAFLSALFAATRVLFKSDHFHV